MTSRTPTLGELFEQMVQGWLADVRVCMPGRVESYDSAKQIADVKPMVRDVFQEPDGSLTTQGLPVIPNVPVGMPRGGGFFVALPVQKGDFVILVFADTSIDQWYARGELSDPADLRYHDLSDAFAIPAGYPSGQEISEDIGSDMVAGKDGGMLIRWKDDGTLEASSAGGTMQAVAMADDVKAEFDSVKGDFDSFKTWAIAHQHPVPVGGTSGAPTTAGAHPTPHTPGPVGSSKVKVEE